jgi:hypothetical protein
MNPRPDRPMLRLVNESVDPTHTPHPPRGARGGPPLASATSPPSLASLVPVTPLHVTSSPAPGAAAGTRPDGRTAAGRATVRFDALAAMGAQRTARAGDRSGAASRNPASTSARTSAASATSSSATSAHATSATQIARENIAAAMFPAHDARWILATSTSSILQGGRAAFLPPDRRHQLMTLAKRLGLRDFDASLVIAIAQDNARAGIDPQGREAASRLALVGEPRGPIPTPTTAWDWLRPLAAATILGAVWAYLLGSWLLGR